MQNVENTHIRKGVLTFHIQGGTHAVAAIQAMAAAAEEEEKEPPVPVAPAPSARKDLKVSSENRARTSSFLQDMKQVHDLMERLHMTPSCKDHIQVSRSFYWCTAPDQQGKGTRFPRAAHCLTDLSPHTKKKTVRAKEFPELLDDFFDAIRKWLQVVIETRSEQLQDQQGHKAPMYQ